MRQYKLLFKRPGKDWITLEPYVHKTLYNHQEVWDAVDLIRTSERIVAVVLEMPDGLLNIISFAQEAEAPKSFRFDKNYV